MPCFICFSLFKCYHLTSVKVCLIQSARFNTIDAYKNEKSKNDIHNVFKEVQSKNILDYKKNKPTH